MGFGDEITAWYNLCPLQRERNCDYKTVFVYQCNQYIPWQFKIFVNCQMTFMCFQLHRETKHTTWAGEKVLW